MRRCMTRVAYPVQDSRMTDAEIINDNRISIVEVPSYIYERALQEKLDCNSFDIWCYFNRKDSRGQHYMRALGELVEYLEMETGRRVDFWAGGIKRLK